MFHQSSYKCSQAIHVPLNTPVRVYCLQNHQPGALYLLLSPGRSRVPRHVGRVQGGVGVGGHLGGEVGELIASRGLELLEQWEGRELTLPDMTKLSEA